MSYVAGTTSIMESYRVWNVSDKCVKHTWRV